MYVGLSLIYTCKVTAKECNISALSIIFLFMGYYLCSPQGRAFFVRSATLCKQQSPNSLNRCRCANLLFCLSFIARSRKLMSNKSRNFALTS